MAAAYSSHAKSPSVLLGYPDEDASAAVDYTTNVIGGMPVRNGRFLKAAIQEVQFHTNFPNYSFSPSKKYLL